MSAAEQKQAAAGAATTTEAPGLLDQVVTATRSRGDQEKARAKTYVEEFVRQALKPGHVVSKDTENNIKTWIAEIDKKLTGQLNAIMHHEDFQKLESTWRGLHY